MKVDVLEAFFAFAVLYGVGRYLFWLNKTIITDTADAVFGHFQRQGADEGRRRRRRRRRFAGRVLQVPRFQAATHAGH